MDNIDRILVVSRMTKDCREAIHLGISMAQKYEAELSIIHVVHDPLIFGAWNLPKPSLEEEYKKTFKEAKQELDAIIHFEKKKGMNIKEIIKEGDPTEVILSTVQQEKIDLIIMLAHEEGHLEHFLFGRANEAIIRKLPCSVLLLKKEPKQA
jgi:nucleotide-binding universal stress UspA family protein